MAKLTREEREFYHISRAEGHAEERQAMAISLLQIGVLSIEQIASVTKMTIEEVEIIKRA